MRHQVSLGPVHQLPDLTPARRRLQPRRPKHVRRVSAPLPLQQLRGQAPEPVHWGLASPS
jgi:hypothetical protein